MWISDSLSQHSRQPFCFSLASIQQVQLQFAKFFAVFLIELAQTILFYLYDPFSFILLLEVVCLIMTALLLFSWINFFFFHFPPFLFGDDLQLISCSFLFLLSIISISMLFLFVWHFLSKLY